MRYLYCMRIAIFILWRAFQITVVIPATIVAVFLAIFTLMSPFSPVQDLVTDVHSWAKMDVCPAPAGTVRVLECIQPSENGDKPADPGVLKRPCVSTVAKATPIDEFARDVDHQVRFFCAVLYGLLLVVAFGTVVLAYSGRQLFGLGDGPAQTGGDPKNDTVAKEFRR